MKMVIKKLLSLLMIAILCTPLICNYIHNEKCGYDPVTKIGCTRYCIEIDSKNIYQPPD